MKRLPVAILLLTASALAQVSVISSPVSGNPASLTISFDGTQVGQVVLQIHPTPGQQGGACYAMIERYLYGVRVKLFNTSQGYPDSFVYGDFGWNQVLTSNGCKVNLAQSSRPDYYTYILNMEMLPGLTGNNQVVSFWEERTCTPWCSWGWSLSTTLGNWNSGGASANGPLLNPVPGLPLTGSSVNFQWSPVPGASYYWLAVGDNSSNWNYASTQIGGTSYLVTGLPIDGREITVRLLWMLSGVWHNQDYTFRTLDASVPAVIQSPAQGALLTGGTTVPF